MGEQQGGHRYAKADAEVAGYYMSALGLKGQSYESGGVGAFDANEAAGGRLVKMRWLEGRRSDTEWFVAVESTLARLPRQMRHVLALVYEPHGWEAWLASALAVPWGAGSLVLLAASTPRALTAATGHATPAGALSWLVGRGAGSSEALFKNLRDDAEALRVDALAAYEVERAKRVKVEVAAERTREAERRRRGSAIFDDLMGRRGRRRTDVERVAAGLVDAATKARAA